MKRKHRLIVDITLNDKCGERTARNLVRTFIEDGISMYYNSAEVTDYEVDKYEVKTARLVEQGERNKVAVPRRVLQDT